MNKVCVRNLLRSLFANLLFIPGADSQTKTLRSNTVVDENINGFFEYLPASYYAQPGKKFALLIFFHGLGTAGNGSEESLQNLVNSGWGTPPWRAWRDYLPTAFQVNGTPMELIIITPQFIQEPYYTMTTNRDINALIYYAFGHYRIDHSRVYLAGQSAGGAYALNFVGSEGTNALKIAAVLASSPGPKSEFLPNQEKGNIISRDQIPVWIETSELDESAPSDPGIYDRTATNWLNFINGAIPTPFYFAHLSVLQGSNAHGNAAAVLYNPDITENNLNAYQWALQFQRSPALPIAFFDFHTSVSGKSIDISWHVSPEKNNKGFYIQESSDGKTFKEMDFVPNHSNSLGSSYTYRVKQPHPGITYFRLEQVDYDGRIFFSEIQSVRLVLPDEIVITPNPVHNTLHIRLNMHERRGTLQIIDNMGRISKVIAGIESGERNVDVSNLQKGVFHGRILSPEGTMSFSFIKN